LKNLFDGLFKGLNSLFSGAQTKTTQPVVPPSQPMSPEAAGMDMMKLGLESSLNGLSYLDNLSSLDGPELRRQHPELAKGNGAIRSTTTALQVIKQFGPPELSQTASNLLDTKVEGHAFQQWGINVGVVPDFIKDASPEQMQTASEKIHTISSQANELKELVIRHLEPKQEPSSAPRVREIAARYEADNDLGIGGGRSAKDDSKKTALDAVSFLSTPSGIKTKPELMIGNLDLMLGSKEINKLQDALSNGDISFTMIKNSVSSKGDLSMVRELALSTVSKQEAKYTGSIGEIVNSLSHVRPNIGAVMQGLKGFIDTSALQWFDKTAEKPEDSLDANAHARFDEALMNSALNDMSTSDLKDTLTHLEGPFGERMRSVLNFVAGQVPMSDLVQDDGVLISTSMRFGVVVEGLITAIREKLGENTNVSFKDGELINSLEQLKPMEKAALLRVGISEEMLV
jgi:hypothetical protein